VGNPIVADEEPMDVVSMVRSWISRRREYSPGDEYE